MRRLRAGLAALVALLTLTAAAPALGATAEDPGDALRKAASAGDLAKVKELVTAGADVNAVNAYGGTALAFACDRGHVTVVDFLLERGANVNTKDTFYGATPLTWAVEHGHAEIVRSLLAKGAEGEGEALTAAAGSGDAAVVSVVLARGKASAEQLSDALAAAKLAEKPEVVKLLEAAGAKPHPTVTVDPAVLASYAGAYAGEGFDINVAVQEGKLLLTSERGMKMIFVARDPTTFRAEVVPGFGISFQVEAGKVNGVTLHRGDQATPLKRKETPP